MDLDVAHASIVAFYGPKSGTLRRLVENLQQFVVDALDGSFRPRPVDDVHATVIGLDRTVADGRSPDVEKLCEFVRHSIGCLAPTIQFGGFPDTDDGFLSRGDTLHDRTLIFDRGQIVVIGWPVSNRNNSGDSVPVGVFGTMRRRCEQYGVRHKYHAGPEDLDPDVYMVLGEYSDRGVGEIDIARLQSHLRREVLGTPTCIDLQVSDLSLVEYEETSLPGATTMRWALDELPLE